MNPIYAVAIVLAFIALGFGRFEHGAHTLNSDRQHLRRGRVIQQPFSVSPRDGRES